MVHRSLWLQTLYTLLLTRVCIVASWEVPVSHRDSDRLVCSGMWGGRNDYIEVSFDLGVSRGQIAMVIYESRDDPYLGKTSGPPGLEPKTYICNSLAIRDGLCEKSQYGRFVLDLPHGKAIENTSFWSAGIRFREVAHSRTHGLAKQPPEDFGARSEPQSALLIGDLPPSQRQANSTVTTWQEFRPSPADIVWYDGPIHYAVRELRYYCVAIVPVIAWVPEDTSADGIPESTRYMGTILFHNSFSGKLPAKEHPKLYFYFALFCCYLAFAVPWSWVCWQNAEILLTVQYYLSGLLGIRLLDIFANWFYYYCRDTYGDVGTSAALHLIVVILDSTSDAFALFVLLVLSLGSDILINPLGRITNIKATLLAFAQGAFGVLYATVGAVEPTPHDPDYLFILPRDMYLAILLAVITFAFFIWVAHALTGERAHRNKEIALSFLVATITQLSERRQSYKLSLYLWLRRILLLAVVLTTLISGVIYSMVPRRAAADHDAKVWRFQWLLDAWPALLRFAVFVGVAWVWRPTRINLRLAMFEEIPDNDRLEWRASEGSTSIQEDTLACTPQTADEDADGADRR
ncbi:hypothetical protein PYCCODRAFT_1458672 [Trametes coccinea BRFM310]|uniref:Uncharacterized protein n=1 Tax=Trametes coccinea (strain BRFM310) TaxID=1353009 RepID=A0A1Y2IQC1_TRAC3|nr:hypothetical protein PYCCODRAFT_1458672 [Trametes coccinea BRFM310]